MQNLINQSPAKKNYDFIDVIRGIAMMSIVAEHCMVAGWYTYPYGTPLYWTYMVLVQLTKFGTVTFFLLAGFLMGDKFADYSPAQYLKRRVSTTFGPWLFWSLLFVAANVAGMWFADRAHHTHEFNLNNILTLTKSIYLYSNYWFIINFFISISILLILRRYLYSFYLGAIFCLFTLFYAVNIHYEWVSPQHTTAILGFVFFLWLGAQLRKNLEAVELFIKKTPYLAIISLVLLMFALSIYEAATLVKSADPINTLRLSNVLYSLVFFLLLLKFKTFKFVSSLKPRQTTFGIYLIHFILIIFLLPKIFGPFHINVYHLTPLQFFLFKLSNFLIAYVLTFFIVLLISKSRAKRLIGN